MPFQLLLGLIIDHISLPAKKIFILSTLYKRYAVMNEAGPLILPLCTFKCPEILRKHNMHIVNFNAGNTAITQAYSPNHFFNHSQSCVVLMRYLSCIKFPAMWG